MNVRDTYEAEQAIIGNIINDSNNSKIALEALTEDDFVDPKHKIIFSLLLDLYKEHDVKEGFSLDTVIVVEKIKERKVIKSMGGAKYINELLLLASGNDKLEDYIKIIQDNSLARNFIDLMNNMINKYNNEPIDTSSFLAEAEESVLKITRRRHVSDFTNIYDAVNKAIAYLGSKSNSFDSGYEELNRKIGGFQPGNLTILAARPSVGKTAMAIAFALKVASTDKTVGIFSLEMSTEQIISRFLNDLAGLSTDELKSTLMKENSQYKDGEQAARSLQIKKAAARLKKMKIFIDDSSSNKLSDIQAKARKLKSKFPDIGLIVIDYIGLITSQNRGNNFNRQNEVAEISRGLKALARDLEVPVLALSQLSRQVDSRPKHIPVLSDLRESGAIEQDADQVFFLYRPDYYNDEKKEEDSIPSVPLPDDVDGGDSRSIVQLIIAKNRNGQLGKIEFVFDKAHCHFEESESLTGLPTDEDY